MTSDTSGGKFPFDCIIVTSPDAASAASAEAPLSRVLERRLASRFPDQKIRIVSTFDSYGARCGSGGGTIAALEFTSPGETVLVLHAGGDSSRCPTQMILGKAWTSLPSNRYENPTVWLTDQIHQLFDRAQFPRGSVVVAATDCLISLFRDANASIEPLQYDDESAVLGIAVPAVVNTAKNHGVYLLPESAPQYNTIGVLDPLEVWQKPSLEALKTTTEPVPASFASSDNAKSDMAWIDTGVIVFLPKAAGKLYELSEGSLSLCTRKGLKAAYEKQPGKYHSVEDFARDHALKVDLYTDILHNLSWSSQRPKEETILRQTLKQHPLRILFDPNGRFLHLGTTKELVDFVTTGAFPTARQDSVNAHSAIAELSESFFLQPRYRCWSAPPSSTQNVALWSTFPETAEIGHLAHVEYCDFREYKSITIGDGSMVSGWRNPLGCKAPLEIPRNVSIQMLKLKEENLLAYMVLGTSDGIKTSLDSSTIFGLGVTSFFARTGLCPMDLGWSDDFNKEDCLWNALIHPKIPEGTPFDALYSWLMILHDGGSVEDDSSLKRWKECPRVSLRQLHSLADARTEWLFRERLEAEVNALTFASLPSNSGPGSGERSEYKLPKHTEWIRGVKNSGSTTENVVDNISSMEETVLPLMMNGEFAECGHLFMIASASLAALEDNVDEKCNSNRALAFEAHCQPHVEALGSITTSREQKACSFAAILKRMKEDLQASLYESIGSCTVIMERLSLCMNKLCVASGFLPLLPPLLSKKRTSFNANRWKISMAPARVDLAGSWSDTPPVCFEFGGSVTGAAVLVDDLMPLSCRCRVVEGKQGILLRSEIRNPEDGSLTDSMQVTLLDMTGLDSFNDPLSECALLKCVLVCIGMITEDEIKTKASLQPLINKFFVSSEDLGVEVVTTSLLPQGSGMGTSSILAACCLNAVAECAGLGQLDQEFLLHGVLMLEQLLTAGGGWQDQANGILPGFKTVTSKASQIPIKLSVEQLDVTHSVRKVLESRMLLIFTGKTRLAKNILQDVLRRWAWRTLEIVSTVSRNVQLSEDCRAAVIKGDVDALASILNEFSSLKLRMTGEASGAMPPSCRFLINELTSRNIIKGACLCGAGGGGFMIAITSEAVNKTKVSQVIEEELLPMDSALSTLQLHSCQIAEEGLTTKTLQDQCSPDTYDIQWQKYTPYRI